jgi:hypothetical protein
MAQQDTLDAFELAKIINETNGIWSECRKKLAAWQYSQDQQDVITHAYGQDIDLAWGRFVLGVK